MRTVIYLGLLTIADAISKDSISKESVSFYATIFIVIIAMDVIEFLKKLFK